MNPSTPHPFIKWFADITIAGIPLVGGKNASLAVLSGSRRPVLVARPPEE